MLKIFVLVAIVATVRAAPYSAELVSCQDCLNDENAHNFELCARHCQFVEELGKSVGNMNLDDASADDIYGAVANDDASNSGVAAVAARVIAEPDDNAQAAQEGAEDSEDVAAAADDEAVAAHAAEDADKDADAAARSHDTDAEADAPAKDEGADHGEAASRIDAEHADDASHKDAVAVDGDAPKDAVAASATGSS